MGKSVAIESGQYAKEDHNDNTSVKYHALDIIKATNYLVCYFN